ncbi:hypothetical protein NQ315_009891 [Exocentrus adspersus]|uniref:UBA domain-containing protein n=1 Tax=Exocentrus adspersus TaxID=1586481 RepID=A0AAV8WJT7_9CUCU|nr:hypothetical protein NQ315_009891 [Exocentrus adspersus]
MSSSNRTTSKGGKGSGDKQQHRDTNSKGEDPSIKDKVKQLIEMSQRSEEEVCLALHECDNDINLASNMLFENENTGKWETRVKKKKNRQASAGKQEKQDENAAAVDDWNDSSNQTSAGGGGANDKEKGRNKSGGPPRLHGRNNDNRGWRGRERQENERNLDEGGRPDFQRDRDRRGRPSSTRGGGGRGRGGGRAGGRYPPRGNRSNTYNKPIETWDNSNTWDNSTAATANHNAEETWDDFPGADEWSTEEYQGSLADTKVFTPSIQPSLDVITESSVNQPPLDPTMGQSLQMGQPSQSPVPPMVGTLTAAQTQYFSQLQQNSDSLNKQYAQSQTFQSQTYEKNQPQYSSGATSQPYSGAQQYVNPSNTYATSGYQPVNNSYSATQEQIPAQQPARTKTQRARVPPPSKIPASAVEMPGDLNTMGYLDVQFGAMDLIEGNTTFEGNMDNKYSNAQSNSIDAPISATATTLDLNNSNQNLDAYTAKNTTQSSISSALSQSVNGLSNSDGIPQPTSEHLTGGYNTAPRSTQGSSSTAAVSVSASGLDLTKQPESHSYPQSSNYSSYQSKANTYNSSSYNTTQTTASSYVSNQANSYVNNQAGSYNPPSGNTYPNTYSSNSSYQSNANSGAFPSISQANAYPSSNQSYPQNTSQSVYGGNTGLNNSSNYANASTSQYNSYSSGSSHKLVKDNAYDNSSSTASSSQTTTTSNATSSAALSLTQTSGSGSKASTTLAAKNSSSVVSNIPPGVAPVMSTPYIMGQVPYFQQPVYSYEEMQLLQQRLPHMTTPYYDMSYQTPTTIGAVRDATLASVGYSISDGRYTRGDNNASPVPSTLSQQTSTLTQGHQAQPILAGTAPPYFFATAFNTIAPNYQFGTMYTQLPAATNAHGSSNSNQYPKPATYGSGYSSYDALNPSQDYTKGGYVGTTQGQKGSGANASSTGSAGNDLSAMYGKSHTALGKVNSYEKQGFHSGTPPPFTGALHGSQNAGLAPSGTGFAPQVYIPTMAPHQQHHSTHLMQQPLHQMDVRHQGRRVDSGNTGGQRSQASNQAKAGAKQPYQASYWNQA